MHHANGCYLLVKLFDSLIVPVLSYGCQVWLFSTRLFKLIASGNFHRNNVYTLRRIASDPIEQIHLKFLKWTLALHKKSSNLACWGDTGRAPLVIQLLKQSLEYYNRLNNFDINDSSALVRHAFVEQRTLQLPWFNTTNEFLDLVKTTNVTNSSVIREQTASLFSELWHSAIASSTKLCFYQSIKTSIGFEPYLLLKDPSKRCVIARLRSSSHRLNIETGRYAKFNSTNTLEVRTWNKCCKTCSFKNVALIINLPFAEPILEDELHVLISCPRYDYIRMTLDDITKSMLLTSNTENLTDLFSIHHIDTFATYVKKIFSNRFPKN